MKGNNGTGNNMERDEWETPLWLYQVADYQYNFSFDCCANEDNSKHQDYTSDFLKCNIHHNDVCWMNPPFSKAKVMFEHFFKVIKQGVAIYRCDNMETAIWQKVIFPKASWIFVFDKRVAYEGMEGKGSRFPSALIGYNVAQPIGFRGVCLNLGYNG